MRNSRKLQKSLQEASKKRQIGYMYMSSASRQKLSLRFKTRSDTNKKIAEVLARSFQKKADRIYVHVICIATKAVPEV